MYDNLDGMRKYHQQHQIAYEIPKAATEKSLCTQNRIYSDPLGDFFDNY